RPGTKPAVICRPANQCQYRPGKTHFSEANQQLPRFQPAHMASHQRVKQQEIDCRNKARRKSQTTVSPPEPKGKKPVQKKVRADRKETDDHWRVAFADCVKRRR